MKHDRVSMIQLCRLLVLSTLVQTFENVLKQKPCNKYKCFSTEVISHVVKLMTRMLVKPKCANQLTNNRRKIEVIKMALSLTLI